MSIWYLDLYRLRSLFVFTSSAFKYPYSKRYILTFDCEVIYPEIPISLQTKYGVIEEMFLLDTGADITTLPNYARYLFEETPTEGDHEMYGIGGSSKFWKSAITINLLENGYQSDASLRNMMTSHSFLVDWIYLVSSI